VLDSGAPELTLWPNPNNGQRMDVQLSGVDAVSEGMEFLVFDAMGKLVFQERYTMDSPQLRTTLAFRNPLPTGQYLLRATSGEQLIQQRFVVSH
jgi:hypothetical protein